MQTLLQTCWNKVLDNAVSLSGTGLGTGSGHAAATDFLVYRDTLICKNILGWKYPVKDTLTMVSLEMGMVCTLLQSLPNNLPCQCFSCEDFRATSSFHNHHL